FKQLDHCKWEIENKIQKDVVALLQKNQKQKKSGGVADPALGAMWYHLQYTLANTFRYALLVSVCSVLEETVKTIAEKQFPSEVKKLKSKSGNWLRKHLDLFATHPGFATTDELNESVSDFEDIITLRNCICHNWGSIAKNDKPKKVREALQRIE